MTVYAYARVSTQKQDLERQITNIIRAYPEIREKNIYTEKATGRKIVREVFCKLLKKLHAGDVLVLDSVSRFSREAEAGFELYEELYRQGIEIVFIKEPYINTSHFRSAMNVSLPEVEQEALKPMMEGIQKTLMLLAKDQFKEAFRQAEKEAVDTSQRVREGMREKGAGEKIRQAKLGKPKRSRKAEEIKEKIRKYSKDFEGSMKDADLIPVLDCSRNSFYKYKRELSE